MAITLLAAAPATEHMAAAALESPAADVAVLFSGWLNVVIPDRGAQARASLVDPLGADVIVAGTFRPSDCPNKRHARGQCLLPRLRGLEPISKLGLSPMLRMRELRAHAEASPSFARVSRDFNARETFNGVTIFAPVLGNHNVSVLRELSDYSRSLALCEEHERARGRQYERLVFSRLEFVWLAPHPPLALMPAREALPPHRPIVWVPSGQKIVGVNDRHAVVPRASADVYFRRWELLQSPTLEALVPLAALRHGGPEDFLDGVLVASKVAIGLFPATALLALPWRRPLLRFRVQRDAARGQRAAPPWATVPPGGAGAVEGKYPTEVRDAVYHWRFLQCAGAAPELRPELLSKRWAFDPGGAQRPHRVLVSVPAGRRTLALDALTPLVRLDRTRDASPRARAAAARSIAPPTPRRR